MRQAETPARGGAARASLGLQVVFGCSLLLTTKGLFLYEAQPEDSPERRPRLRSSARVQVGR